MRQSDEGLRRRCVVFAAAAFAFAVSLLSSGFVEPSRQLELAGGGIAKAIQGPVHELSAPDLDERSDGRTEISIPAILPEIRPAAILDSPTISRDVALPAVPTQHPDARAPPSSS